MRGRGNDWLAWGISISYSIHCARTQLSPSDGWFLSVEFHASQGPDRQLATPKGKKRPLLAGHLQQISTKPSSVCPLPLGTACDYVWWCTRTSRAARPSNAGSQPLPPGPSVSHRRIAVTPHERRLQASVDDTDAAEQPRVLPLPPSSTPPPVCPTSPAFGGSGGTSSRPPLSLARARAAAAPPPPLPSRLPRHSS